MRTVGMGCSIAFVACALLTATSALAEPAVTIKTQKVDVKVETIATGLEHPWAVDVLPDSAYLAPRTRIRHFTENTL